MLKRASTLRFLTLLAEELKQEGGIHALSIDAKTPAQYSKNPDIHKTPPCAGGHA